MTNHEKSDYDKVMSSYFGDEQVTAMISLKVETKEADVIAEAIAENDAVDYVYLVTGDTDIVAMAKFQTYGQLKRFLMETVTSIPGIKETKTSMVVTTFKEGGELKYEKGEPLDHVGAEK
ncbi:Lrp/AsnC family transcriptional regulator [Methanomassiliicoccus luminyensis]|jgi:DNA-binding Lrp family transcriptional regulator|uniref:Lrp/AsnC family transcriptional regulator n=1 Tax=Methanomassiliicoccus luminyensis TaxID=1080712 RepID=UPI00036F8341|nr:Lrp/AsnC ligand binding domain-containing protein [Methanomassiliicoccus luminyensis]